MRQLEFDEIKVGDLLGPDPDIFMLGDRWIVESITDNEIEFQIYHCGVCLPRNNGWYHGRISKKDSEFKFWTRGETLEQWINYYTSYEKRRLYYEASVKQLKDMGYIDGYSV